MLTDTSSNGTLVDGVKVHKSSHGVSWGIRVEVVKGRPNLCSVVGQCVDDGGEGALTRHDTLPLPVLDELNKCPICLYVQFKTVNAIPCMHEACSPCAYKHSTTASNPSRNLCPVCSRPLADWQENHATRQRVDVFLQRHPEYRRSEGDVRALETAQQVPKEGMRVPCREGCFELVRRTEEDLLSELDARFVARMIEEVHAAAREGHTAAMTELARLGAIDVTRNDAAAPVLIAAVFVSAVLGCTATVTELDSLGAATQLPTTMSSP